MTKKTVFVASALGLALAGAGIGFANEPYFPRAQKSFDRVDTNKDGKIGLREFATVADRKLLQSDGNGDKIVTAAEIDAVMLKRLQTRRQRMMALMDANHDGSITESELDKVVEDMFKDADNDKDGGVTMAELKTFKRGVWRKGFLRQFAAQD